MEKALSLKIDNIRKRKDLIKSDPFSSGGCEWFVRVYPCKYRGPAPVKPDRFTVCLDVLNSKSLSPGWKRSVRFCFVLLTPSGKEFCRSPDEFSLKVYHSGVWSIGYTTSFTLTRLLKELENKDKLTLEFYINVVEVVPPTRTINFNGFLILSSQAKSVSRIYAQHPDFALNFKPKNPGVKTAYMNLLLALIGTLSKCPHSLSVAELTKAQNQLTDLTEAGFKLNWLKEILLERKKAFSDGSNRVQQLEERVKIVESSLSDLKVEVNKGKIKSAAAAKLPSFEIIDLLIKRFCCFSISKY